ncbi:MAG: sigma-70 family RNA polymerase sigma factor [Gemmataceae bacterium]|nr:sigma-70 family RNA polymerase sigma factor [Gemmataceae bacterium]
MTKSEDPRRNSSRAPNDPSDSSLLRRLRDGNQDAATQLYLRYADRLRILTRAECSPDLARRVDVDDIVQSVFSSFFRGVGQGYYEVPHGDELWKLFLVIALNKIRAKGAFHRAAKRDVRLTAGSELLENWVPTEHESTEMAHTFLRMVIDEALEAVSEVQKRMIQLRIEGHEVAEIAVQTQRSKRTVERVLQEFRTKLAAILRADEGPEYRPEHA